MRDGWERCLVQPSAKWIQLCELRILVNEAKVSLALDP